MLWLSAWTIHHANHVRPARDGLKVGGSGNAACGGDFYSASRVRAMFFKRRKVNECVHEGSVFERVHSTNMVEQAEVLWVGNDAAGIPHVRFRMSYLRARRIEPQGMRMLALACFAERYQRLAPRAVA